MVCSADVHPSVLFSSIVCSISSVHPYFLTTAMQIKEHVSASGWQVSGDLVTLPKNELNSPVVVKRTQVGGTGWVGGVGA
jgi:hypothetical protein